MIIEIQKCRICGNPDLTSIVNLGVQALTGLFPKEPGQRISEGPLELLKCNEANGCGLVQLRHSFDINEMYGANYGYRSGLNQSMVHHLEKIAKQITQRTHLKDQDLVVDIGSNDGTLLRSYPNQQCRLLGVDPTGIKFKKYYPKHIDLICDFFSAKAVQKHCGQQKAKVVTSIAMFYDLESPMDFMREIYDVLDDDGIWIFEQSYMPTMLERNSYDTICHEHLEYYCLKQIKWMTDKVGLKIIDVELNDVNGGSFRITVAKKEARFKENASRIDEILRKEKGMKFNTDRSFEKFRKSIYSHRDQLLKFIERSKSQNKTVLGYGASTKGNVILQFCNLTTRDIPFIAEVNADKFGCYTPGTGIPIISEEEAKLKKPDYFMVLPWHFRQNIIQREKDFLKKGGRIVFPLPDLEVYPG
jgi:cyclopropane fatty-acyl-phospholipid synthase-like methyltransferase